MLAIRMQRNGRAHHPVYRLVVQEAQRHPLSGRVVAEVGHYDPHTKNITLDQATIEKYLSYGAQPSTRVAFLLAKNGVKLPTWVKQAPKHSAKAKNPDKWRKYQPKEASEAETTEATPDTASTEA